MALFGKKDRLLGIDISPTAVKLVELSHSGQRYQVEAMAVEPLPEGAVEDRNPVDFDQISPAIKRALKAGDTRLRKAVVAVPSSSVITRTIPMPMEYDDDEIEASIQVEAAQYIPFPLEDIHLDFQIQGPSKNGDDTQDVIIVASRRENVDLRAEVLKEAGLKAEVVDVEAYALENVVLMLSEPFLRAGMSGNDEVKADSVLTAVIDIGAAVTTLYVFQGEKVIFTREQAFGANQLTQAIADAYNLPRERAELAKRSGDLSEDYPLLVLEPYKQSVAEQVNTALQFFFSSSHFNSIDQIILVGGGAMTAGLDKVVANQLGVPTVVGNVFENMTSAKRVNRRSLLRDAPLLTVACGLALRSFS